VQIMEDVQGHDSHSLLRGGYSGIKVPIKGGAPVTRFSSPWEVSFGSTNASFGSCHGALVGAAVTAGRSSSGCC
jgi:hypothetical protein